MDDKPPPPPLRPSHKPPTKKLNYVKEKHFYYNKVSRVAQRKPTPPDYNRSLREIPKQQVFGMNFYRWRACNGVHRYADSTSLAPTSGAGWR